MMASREAIRHSEVSANTPPSTPNTQQAPTQANMAWSTGTGTVSDTVIRNPTQLGRDPASETRLVYEDAGMEKLDQMKSHSRIKFEQFYQYA